ncbi:hypothetical protein TSAR_014630 [Trichomalopsis sarcophagae]|uniref:Uncharacterized protein n=1 Tax=Trichomalopsis sarcophagae TaxID=543379 RepID=A0A232EEX1_9HYME|nr:hypothetical protein TSAR_014630 [Trichomalopsis sarcophagae]
MNLEVVCIKYAFDVRSVKGLAQILRELIIGNPLFVDFYRNSIHLRFPTTCLASPNGPTKTSLFRQNRSKNKSDKKNNGPRVCSRKDAPPIPASMEGGQANLDGKTSAKRLRQRRKDTVKTLAFSDPEVTEFLSASEEKTTSVTLTEENNYDSSDALPI